MTFRAELMSHSSTATWPDPSKSGFATEQEAWDYIYSECKLHPPGKQFPESPAEDVALGYCTYCAAEWDVFEDGDEPVLETGLSWAERGNP